MNWPERSSTGLQELIDANTPVKSKKLNIGRLETLITQETGRIKGDLEQLSAQAKHERLRRKGKGKQKGVPRLSDASGLPQPVGLPMPVAGLKGFQPFSMPYTPRKLIPSQPGTQPQPRLDEKHKPENIPTPIAHDLQRIRAKIDSLGRQATEVPKPDRRQPEG